MAAGERFSYAWLRAVGSWAARNRLVLATGLAASLPVIVSVVGTLSDSWVPITDNALIALRSYDVLTTHPPLLGQGPSTVSVADVGPVYSLGPLLYWLLALPARFIGPVGFPLTIGVINVAAVMSVVALARRRGGSLLMFATAFAVVVMCRSLPTEVLSTPFNPGAALLPFTMLIFLCWSLACGEYRLLPITVVVASFVVQCHLTYALPTLGMLAIGGAGLAWRLLRGPEAQPGGRPRRWLLASLLVGLVCWSAPLLDQVVHRPGNLVALERTARAHQPTVGPASGLRAAVRAVGVPAWWQRRARPPFERYLDTAKDPGGLSIATFAVFVAGLVAALIAGVLRRREEAYAAALALVLIASLVAVTAATPKEKVLTLSYTLWWGAPAGMFVWIALAICVAALLPGRASAWVGERLRVSPRPVAAVSLAGLGMVVAAGSAVGADQPPDPTRSTFSPARTVIARLQKELPAGRTVLVTGPPTRTGFWFVPAIAYGLQRDGVHVVTGDTLAKSMGASYAVKGHRYDETVLIGEGDFPLPVGGKVLLRLPLPAALARPDLPPAQQTITVALAAER